jgi:hypothetical protein
MRRKPVPCLTLRRPQRHNPRHDRHVSRTNYPAFPGLTGFCAAVRAYFHFLPDFYSHDRYRNRL